jgi:CheY-like chemotaxis protein
MEAFSKEQLLQLVLEQQASVPGVSASGGSFGAEVSESWRRKKTRLRTKRLASKARALRKALETSGMHATELQRKLSSTKKRVVELECELCQSRANAEQAMTLMRSISDERLDAESIPFELGAPPIPPATAAAASLPPRAASYTSTCAIVLAQVLLQRMTGNMLSKLSVDFTVFADGSEVIAACADGARFQIILMDRMMTDVGGEKATRSLRAMGITDCIVGLTSESGQADRDAFMAAGLTELCSKPLHQRDWETLAARYIR